MNEGRGIELQDSGRRPQMELAPAGLVGLGCWVCPPVKVITAIVGPSLGQSVQSAVGCRLALSVQGHFCVGPGAGNVWPRGHSNCRKSAEGHPFRGTSLQGLCDPVGHKQLWGQIMNRAFRVYSYVPRCHPTI